MCALTERDGIRAMGENMFGIEIEYRKSGYVEAIAHVANHACVIRDYRSFALEHDASAVKPILRGCGFGRSLVGYRFARRLARREIALLVAERRQADEWAAAFVALFDREQSDGALPLSKAMNEVYRDNHAVMVKLANIRHRCLSEEGPSGRAMLAALFRIGRPLIVMFDDTGRYPVALRLGDGPSMDPDTTPELGCLSSADELAAWRSLL